MFLIWMICWLLFITGILLLPFGTDAPLYHLPFATVGVILLNTLLFFLSVARPVYFEGWWLMLGGSFDPASWLTCTYMHIDALHLVGNMVFLWVFGTVVEGKVGAGRFLLLYHAIGICVSAVAWFLCLGWGDPIPCLGASGAIMGLMAISMVWAPSNNVFCLFSSWFDQEVTLMAIAFYELCYNIAFAGMTGFVMSSFLLHLLGALAGAAAGVWMFKKGMVECDGYDIFAVAGGYAGDTSRSPEKFVTVQEKEERQAQLELEQQQIVIEREENLARLDHYLKSGHIPLALTRFEALKREIPALQLSRDQLSILIRHLQQEQKWKQAIPLMHKYIHRFSEGRAVMRLNLARILIVSEHRPRAGLKVMAEINQKKLNNASKSVFHKLARYAKQLMDDGVIEILDD